jgi:signal transduction histidine kinase
VGVTPAAIIFFILPIIQMSDSQTNFETLFKEMTTPAVIVNGRNRIIETNRAFVDLVMLPHDTIIDSELSKIIRLDDATITGREISGKIVSGEVERNSLVERLDCRWKNKQASLYMVRFSEPESESYPQQGEGLDPDSSDMRLVFDYLREATRQLEVVENVISAVNSRRTIDQVFSIATEQIRALVPFDRASIALCDEENHRLRVFALYGDTSGSLSVGAVAEMHGSVTEFAIDRKRPVVISELKTEERFNPYDDLNREGFRSALCFPLFSNQKAIGSLNLTSRTASAYDRKHILLLERLAPPLAIAIEKALLLEQSENRAKEIEMAARREEIAGRIGRQLSSSLEPAIILQEAVDALGRALGSDRCYIALFEEAKGYSVVAYEYTKDETVGPLRGVHIPFTSKDHMRSSSDTEDAFATSDISTIESGSLLQFYKEHGTRALLRTTLNLGGAPIGVLELHYSSEAQPITTDDKKLFKIVGSQLSVALTNAGLYETTRRRSQEFEELYEISRSFSSLTDSSDFHGRLSSSIAQLAGGDMAFISRFDKRLNVLRAEGPGHNVSEDIIKSFRFRIDPDGGTKDDFTSNTAFFNSTQNATGIYKRWMERYKLHSILCIPMRIQGELIGLIVVGNKAGGFRDRDVQLLEIFAAQVAETITNLKLFGQTRAQAERQALINRLLLSMQQTSDPQQSIQVVVEYIGRALDLDRCLATLQGDEFKTEFIGEWCADGVEPVGNESEFALYNPLPKLIKKIRQPLVATNIRRNNYLSSAEELFRMVNVRSLVAVPILHKSEIIGTLVAHQTRRGRRWSTAEVELLNTVAAHIGPTLENARLITQLTRANQVKDEFLSTLSHELRTPLTAITGWAELLCESTVKETDEELAEGIEVIKSSSNSLTQMINDLLDLSRIQRHVLRIKRIPVDISVPVQSALNSLKHMLETRKLELVVKLDEKLPLMNIDPNRIQQVLVNLLTNAIKFTPDGGRIVLSASLVEGQSGGAAGGWLSLQVEDTGEGIKKEFLPYIWDKFRQADGSSTRRHGGLGIGLALVKELVSAHGGKVSAASEGQGSVFTVLLPVTEIETEEDSLSYAIT